MPIDLMQDKLICLDDVAKMLPRKGGKTVCAQTVKKWADTGIRGVVLEAVPIGASLYTTAECVEDFAEALERKRKTPPPSRLAAKHRRECNRAANRLEAMGLTPQRYSPKPSK
jgi:hypothetical protein